MQVTIPRHKAFLYREVYQIVSYYPTGEAKELKSIGFCHKDSNWKNKPNIDVVFLSTTKEKQITIELLEEP